MNYNQIMLYYLITIKYSNNIYPLIEYCDISTMDLNNIYLDALSKKLTLIINNEIVITEEGETEINILRKKLKLRDISRFVAPYLDYKIGKISKDYVYMPQKKK